METGSILTAPPLSVELFPEAKPINLMDFVVESAIPDQRIVFCKHLYPGHLGQLSRVTHPPLHLLYILRNPPTLFLATAVCSDSAHLIIASRL